MRKKITDLPFVDHRVLNLEEWLFHVKIRRDKRKFSILDCQFATDAHFREYLLSIRQRSDEEVKYLISLFIMTDGHIGHDEFLRDWLYGKSTDDFERAIFESTFLHRIAFPSDINPPWPSLIWILDLLPSNPQAAIQVLSAYFAAHAMYMPDARISGLSDAKALIRAKFIEHDLPVRQTLLDLPSRDFELVVGYLYKKKGYVVEVTQRTRDGGYDVIAVKNSIQEHERLHVECKRYENNIGVGIIRNILGTLNVTNATKAVVVTTANFTSPARQEAHQSKRVELIDVDTFDKQMRDYFDVNWIDRIPQCLFEMRKQMSPQL